MTNDSSTLRRDLKNRHVQLIALGGAIGTGLFLGTASTIQQAGPSVVVSYAVGGIIAFFIMRQLGEMIVEEPIAGSFSNLAHKYWGDFAGLFTGWNYWMLYVLVSMAELTAIGRYVNYWFPGVEQWQTILFFFLMINAINLANVKVFGEMEFWFASVKVIAICCMILFGTYLIFSGHGGEYSSVKNLWQYGGFMPNGWNGLIISIPIVMFSYGGLELIGIAAAETADPVKTIPKAINQIIYRVLIFYIGAILVLLCLYPWNMLGVAGAGNWAEAMEASPFVLIFRNIGIPSAAHVLNFVILTAALSVYNSSVYCNSRMLYGLALQKNAPRALARVNTRGVPVYAIFVSSAATLVCVFLNYIMPDSALGIFMALVVSSMILNWAMISLTHMKFRAANTDKVKNLKFPALIYPLGNYICLAFIGFIFYQLWQLGEKTSVILAPVWIFAVWLSYCAKKKANKKKTSQA